MSKKLDKTASAMTNQDLKKSLDKTRLCLRQEASNAIAFKNAKAKLIYNKRYKPLLLKEKDKAYLKLYKSY